MQDCIAQRSESGFNACMVDVRVILPHMTYVVFHPSHLITSAYMLTPQTWNLPTTIFLNLVRLQQKHGIANHNTLNVLRINNYSNLPI